MVPGPVPFIGIPWFWQSLYKGQRVQETLHYYSSIMLYSFASLLCSKLCRHNVDNPRCDVRKTRRRYHWNELLFPTGAGKPTTRWACKGEDVGVGRRGAFVTGIFYCFFYVSASYFFIYVFTDYLFVISFIYSS